MAWTVIAEEAVKKQFLMLSNVEETCLSMGLLIGQANACSKKAYVAHIAPTPDQSRSTLVKSLDDIDEELVASHARFVTRMLPGGLSILGVFYVSQDDTISSAALKHLRRIFEQIDLDQKGGFFLDGLSSSEQFVLHFCSKSQRCTGKSISRSLGGSVNNVDCRFQNFASTWVEITSEFNINVKDYDISSATSVKDQLLQLLSRLREQIETSFILLDGKDIDKSARLETASKGKPTNTVSATIYTSFHEPAANNDVNFFTSDKQRITIGSIPSKVFVEPSATVMDAITAIKQDLIRTLGSRLELHWDSLVDEEGGSPEEIERVHEPPRRVLLQPGGTRLCYVDYLFPGEKISNAVHSCQDLLDITITEDCVFDNFEVSADTENFMSSSIIESSLKSSPSVRSANLILFLTAGAVLLLALLAYTITSL